MGFLAGILIRLSEWALSKLFAFIGKEIAEKQSQKKNEEVAKEEQKKLEGAKTAKEVEDAARKSLDGL